MSTFHVALLNRSVFLLKVTENFAPSVFTLQKTLHFTEVAVVTQLGEID
jgi:hypothetical protein